MRRLTSILILVFSLVACASAQAAAPVKGGEWSSAYITEADGTSLHAAILRPKGLKATDRTPVILTVSVYDNSSGELGPAGAAEGAAYDPVGPSNGATANYTDILERMVAEGYTYVIVDLRGTGGSSGCQDWGGPGEQADVVSAVDWARQQKWSTGHVGIFGKSYDGVTGLIGVAHQPKGLDAVISMEPVYDLYRYLYGDGMRRLNWAATPALYSSISSSPGALGDTPNDPTYTVNSVNDTSRPGCPALSVADQSGNDDHYSPYWRARNFITMSKGSNVPLLLTQGLTENNTAPDGTAEFLRAHTGPERGWLGPWNHVRPNAMQGKRLMMGREGWFDEVFRFYDQYLRGEKPAVADPNFVVQTNDGKWRAEEQWPPADAVDYTTQLNAGTYTDDATSNATGSNSSTGVWTISAPLAKTTILSGAAKAVVDVTSQAPLANLVVDIYDVGPNGTGPLVSRQGHLIRSNGQITLNMMSADWKFAAGHRIGVRVTDDNQDWWLAAVPTKQTVSVLGGTITMPFLTKPRTETLKGSPSVELAPYLAKVATLPAGTKSSEFALPPGATAARR
jgi:predicted acyl esterase